jgi:hypothetical protein
LAAGFLTGFRIFYGLFFVGVTVWVIIARTTGLLPGFAPPTRSAAAFAEGLQQIRFIFPLIALTNIAGGAALLSKRTAPLGVVLLAPSVTGIFFYHLLFTGLVWWGLLWAAGLALLAWSYRDAFQPLWSYGKLDGG